MNNSKTTVLVLTAVFLLSGSLALFADTSNADSEEYTVKAYTDNVWCRTTEKISLPTTVYGNSTMIFKSTDYDATFQEFINGDKKYSELESDYEYGTAGEYYVYFLNDYNTYISGTSIDLKKVDYKTFSHPAFEWNLLDKGTNKLKITSITDNSGETSPSVSVKIYGNTYTSSSLGKDSTYEFSEYEKGFCLVTRGQFATAATVTFTMNIPLKNLTPGTADKEITLATQCKWAVAETQFNAGTYTYNSSETLALLEKGSEKEKLFLETVVNAGKGGIPAEYRLGSSFEILNGGTYRIYKMNTSEYENEYIYFSYTSTISPSSYQHLNLPATYLKSGENHYTIFSPANKEVSVVVEYDSSLYQAMWVTNSSAQGWRESDVPLPSGYVIKNTSQYATEGYVKIIYIGSGNDESMMAADLKISVSGAAEPTGAPTALIGVSIALCVIPFLLLGLSGLRPKWAK